ncbi:MAG: ABC transporter permease [Sphingopyxis sp.]|jgi:ABC-2 type transport system permease protein|uniref:ABC transporter permease n=1 Tax=Sphingopyxis sp. TaxID=1908224 RepID=UPI001A584D21|nr:ABC transporter permease [Sphingopyxis sp.]MBL9068910.1 ABC transporter permease [Sphingopyxis sp.]
MISNFRGIRAIYRFEMARFGRTVWTSLLLPVITTTLYFVVFGSAIGSRMSDVSTVPYGAFIVPGLMMLTMFTESIGNASFGIYMPKWTGTIYEMLSSPMSPLELLIAYVGAAATKSVIIGSIIFATAHLFVDVQVAHPVLMVGFMILMAVTFCLFGFIIGIWAQSFEQLQVIPMLVVYPLTFLGGAFYSLDMLPAAWRVVTLFNPVVYLISGFRWTFFGQGDVGIEVSMGAVALFLLLCLTVIFWMFRTGYRLKN